MRRVLAKFMADESGQAMVERALIAVFFTILILSSTRFVVDGLVSYYAYVTGIICLPVP